MFLVEFPCYFPNQPSRIVKRQIHQRVMLASLGRFVFLDRLLAAIKSERIIDPAFIDKRMERPGKAIKPLLALKSAFLHKVRAKPFYKHALSLFNTFFRT